MDERLGLDLGADPTFGALKRVHVGYREHEPWPQDLIARLIAEASPHFACPVLALSGHAFTTLHVRFRGKAVMATSERNGGVGRPFLCYELARLERGSHLA